MLLSDVATLAITQVELANREDDVDPVDRHEPAGQCGNTGGTVEGPEAPNDGDDVDPSEPLHERLIMRRKASPNPVNNQPNGKNPKTSRKHHKISLLFIERVITRP